MRYCILGAAVPYFEAATSSFQLPMNLGGICSLASRRIPASLSGASCCASAGAASARRKKTIGVLRMEIPSLEVKPMNPACLPTRLCGYKQQPAAESGRLSSGEKRIGNGEVAVFFRQGGILCRGVRVYACGKLQF